ncbi:MAG: hypothetical protein QNI99_02955 [Woeseiaceae bacterium]|nr:hypothetical protein [Woeseiaceae bacterium]
MTEERDPKLEALFIQAEENLADDGYVDAVVGSLRRHRRNSLIGRFTAVLLLVALEFLLSAPFQNSAAAIANALSMSLIDIEGQWLAFALAPLNSVAGLLGMLLIWLHFLYRRRTR